MSDIAAGSAPTRPPNVGAGTVVAPSSSTLAPIQQVMPISRLVAESFNRPWSVASRMLLSTGSVERVATARPTIDRPLARFSRRQLTLGHLLESIGAFATVKA